MFAAPNTTDPTSPLAHHGGNLAAARALFPAAPTPWLDLSTGINPVAYPIPAIPVEAYASLPQAAQVGDLEAAAARAYGATDLVAVAAAPGTQAIIQLLPRLIAARKVGILDLSYAEHAAVWRAFGAEVTTVQSVEDLAQFEAAVIVNPNNPDGRLVRVPALQVLARQLAQKRRTLVVDEAFMDVLDPAASIVPAMPEPGVVVLRSFGKAFGLAGLRLGFAISDPRFAARMRAALGPWAVSGPAITIGRAALSDRPWLDAAKSRLRADAAALDTLLAAAGFTIVGGTPLFRLAARGDAGTCFVSLARAGVLVRPFASQPTWLRFGVPHGSGPRGRLRQALLRDG